MALKKTVNKVKYRATFLFLITSTLAGGNALATDKIPVGPEFASREIGVLLKAYPMLVQQNSMAPGGVGTTLWGCDYQVGRAVITITIPTDPIDPMPCKRKVAFSESPKKIPEGQ